MMAIYDNEIDPAIIRWCGEPKVFVAKSRMAVWCLAYADYYGKDIGLDLGFMGSVSRLGFVERFGRSGGYVLEVGP